MTVAPGLEVTVFEAADPDRVLASAVAGGGDPYAAIVWPSAIALARELATVVRPGNRLLDLGAGTGLCALTAARLGARATALDHDPGALALIGRAAALQGLAVETRAFDLAGDEALPPAEIAVLADLLYEPALARVAARRALEVLGRGGRVLVGDPQRVGRSEFVAALGAATATFQERMVDVPGEPRPARVGIAWITGAP